MEQVKLTRAFMGILFDELTFHECKKLVSSFLLGPEAAQHAGCDSHGSWFLDAAHGHA